MEGTIGQVIAGEATWCVVHGDCLDVMKSMPDKCVDHVITDPPFHDVVHTRGGNVVRYDGGPDIAKIPFAALDSVSAVAARMFALPRRWSVLFCGDRQLEQWASAMDAVDDYRFVRCGIWVKPDGSPQFSGDRPGHGWEAIVCGHAKSKPRWNGGGHKGVWFQNRIDRESSFLHPTQKPIRLMAELVEAFTDKGEIILDPFCGSGTTLLAAIRADRRAVGIEMNPEYATIARDRCLADDSGNTLSGLRGSQIGLYERQTLP